MNWFEHSHEIVACLTIGAWIAGMALLVLGRRARDLHWISFSVLALFSIGIAIDLFFVGGSLGNLGSSQKIWARGWIGPRDQAGAITIGIIEDRLGLTIVLFGAIVGSLFSLCGGIIRREPDSERALSGLLMSVAGVAVAWLSLTPWLAIMGLALTTLGGVITFDANPDPELIAQFATERSWGFVLSFLGAAVLAGGRGALTLSQGFALAPSGLPHVFDWIGGLLLAAGLYLHLHPFPFLGWPSRVPKVSSAASAIVGQLLPALACFGLMIRFEPELRSIGVFGVFEWVAVGSALLAALCGLAQPDGRTALPLWISSSLAFAFAALCFSSVDSALAILIGTVLSGSALSISACISAETRWVKTLIFLSAASGMGLVGFVGGGGLVELMFNGAQAPARAALLCLSMIFCNLLLWKTAFAIFHSRTDTERTALGTGQGWLPIFSGWTLVVLSFGLLWTGTLTGGALPGDPDRIFSSWMLGMTETLGVRATWGDASAVATAGLAQGLYWIGILLPVLVSLWLFGRKQDLVIKSLAGSPRLRSFLETGYATDRLGSAMARALRRSGEFVEKWVSEKISSEWIPSWLERGLRAPARWISAADRHVYLKEEQLVRRWTEVPAKALQLIQNGDVQWYLFFAIGSIAAILIHFFGHILTT